MSPTIIPAVQGLSSLPRFLKLSLSIKVVDVGANPNDGEPPYVPLLTSGYAHVVGFEPNPNAFEKLVQRKGPNETYMPFAVGDGLRHDLHFCQAEGMTSLLEPNPDLLSLFHGFPEWGTIIATESVDTVRLDDIKETESLDFLKIDIQGAELMVFQNAIDRLGRAVLIHTEVEFLPMYRGQPLYADVDHFLRAHGFVLHRFYSLKSRVVKPMMINNDRMAGLSQLLWADAVFIRDFTKPDLMSPDQLLRLAVILHDCYRSYDLVLHLLRAYDRVTDSNHSDAYFKAVTGTHS